jgi:hypothetical protein
MCLVIRSQKLRFWLPQFPLQYSSSSELLRWLGGTSFALSGFLQVMANDHDIVPLLWTSGGAGLIAIAPGGHLADSAKFPYQRLRAGLRLMPLGPESRARFTQDGRRGAGMQAEASDGC